MTTSDDAERLARGEPAWGDVSPGTDEVRYFVPVDTSMQPALCRMVAKEKAFYVEAYRGHGEWEVDSAAFDYLGSDSDSSPRHRELDPVDAATFMRHLDSGGQPGAIAGH